MTSTDLPLRPLAISMGDPAGIGPEIIIKALLARPELKPAVRIFGSWSAMERACSFLSVDAASLFCKVDGSVTLSTGPSDSAQFVSVAEDKAGPLPAIGQISPQAGRMACLAIEAATADVISGGSRALVTAPIHKEALAAAGVSFPGHTELLQSLAAKAQGKDVSDVPVRMMLSCPGLQTVLMSIHVSLRQALSAVTAANLRQTLQLTSQHFVRLGQPDIRIAVAGVNPHAGEGGLFGSEEVEILQPVVDEMKKAGLNVSGPYAPDTVYMRARQGEFDVVIAMYHDQGLIPVKLLGLEHGVNTTIGLPFLRTSPDHGTAFDLAGTGRASPESLLAAIDQALRWT